MAIAYGWCFTIMLIFLTCFFAGFRDDRWRPTTKRCTHDAEEVEDTQHKTGMMDILREIRLRLFVYGPYGPSDEDTEMMVKMADYDKMKSSLILTKLLLNRTSEQLRFAELASEFIEQRYGMLMAEWTDILPSYNSLHTLFSLDRAFEKELITFINKLELELTLVGEIISDMDSFGLQLFTQNFMKLLDTMMNRSISNLEFVTTYVCKELVDLIDKCETRLEELGIVTEETRFMPIKMPIREYKIDN